MSKLCLLFRPNVAWTDGTNLSLINEVAMIKWVTWENYISQKSLVTHVFYSTFQVTIMWRTIEKSLKKILRQLLLLRNHLKNLWLVNALEATATWQIRDASVKVVTFWPSWMLTVTGFTKAQNLSSSNNIKACVYLIWKKERFLMLTRLSSSNA